MNKTLQLNKMFQTNQSKKKEKKKERKELKT